MGAKDLFSPVIISSAEVDRLEHAVQACSPTGRMAALGLRSWFEAALGGADLVSRWSPPVSGCPYPSISPLHHNDRGSDAVYRHATPDRVGSGREYLEYVSDGPRE